MNIYNKQIVNPVLKHGIQNVYKEKDIVNVYAASDLPSVLAANTTYIINGIITTSNPISVTNDGSCIIGRSNREKDGLIYTGTSTFITITDANFHIDQLLLSATDGSSKLINAYNFDVGAYDAGRNKIISITNSQVKGSYDVFDFSGFSLVDIQNTLFIYIKARNHGVIFNSTGKIEISSCEFVKWFDETTLPTPSNYAIVPMVELGPNISGTSIKACNINASIFHPEQTQDGIRIHNSSTTNHGTIAANTFVDEDLTTGLTANLDYDIQSTFIIQANQDVENGNAKGTMVILDNLIPLNNSGASGPPYSVVLNDANFVGAAGPTNPIVFPVSRRVITSSTNASFQYNSKINGNFFVNLNASVGVNSNGNYTITIQFRQNGIAIPIIAKALVRNTGGTYLQQPISLAIQGTAVEGDIFDILVSCDTANDVLVGELIVNGFQF